MTDFVYVVCEGQSEASFVKGILSPYIQECTKNTCFMIPYVLITSFDRAKGKIHRGGLLSYAKAKNDIIRLAKNGHPLTTMFDFYRLPKDFPGVDEANALNSDLDKVNVLEESLKKDIMSAVPQIAENYLIPYIQLHEFEALFFCDLDALKYQYVDDINSIESLKSEVKGLCPEDINGGDETAPSMRLLKYFRYRKGDRVMTPLKEIGIDRMITECPHFAEWVENILARVENITSFV